MLPGDIKRFVLEGLQRRAAERGKTVPQDLLDFMERADLVLLDSRNERVDFVRAVVTWDE